MKMYDSDIERLRQARAKEMDEWSNAISSEKLSRKKKLQSIAKGAIEETTSDGIERVEDSISPER